MLRFQTSRFVQYVGTEPNKTQDVKKARFLYNGQELGFYEYVRVAVSGGKMDIQSGL